MFSKIKNSLIERKAKSQISHPILNPK